MDTGYPWLERIERLLGLARAIPRPPELLEEYIMQNLPELAAAIEKLIAARQTADQNAAAQTARAEKAEAELAALQQQVATDEATAKTTLDAVDAELAAETASSTVTGGASEPVDTVTGGLGNDLVHEDPTLVH